MSEYRETHPYAPAMVRLLNGLAIQEQRDRRGLSIGQVARMSRVTRTTVARVEAGKPAKEETVRTICRAIGAYFRKGRVYDHAGGS